MDVHVGPEYAVFIGYTERAGQAGGTNLKGKAVKIGSMPEFVKVFGEPDLTTFNFLPEGDSRLPQPEPFDPPAASFTPPSGDSYHLAPSSTLYQLYRAMEWFYLNGGGSCYVVSVGGYSDSVTLGDLQSGIQALERQGEAEDITLLVIPESVLLPPPDCYVLQAAMIRHCGETKRNRMAILDIPGGFAGNSNNQCIDRFRQNLSGALSYAAAYYPWLHTGMVNQIEISLANLTADSDKYLRQGLLQELGASSYAEEKKKAFSDEIEKLENRESLSPAELKALHKTLLSFSPLYQHLVRSMLERLNLLPPASAMAGLYTQVDNNTGVWQAPANLSVAGVIEPAVSIGNSLHEDLNSPLSGKAINAIRAFSGQGTLVWGARTLDANNLDWRYINVRRTVILFEESIRQALKAFVFEPNTAPTWVALEDMISQFLTNQWKMGALAGASVNQAFNVSVGLGKTMTADDIIEGRLRLTVMVAVTRPAEFLILNFETRMETS